MSSNDVAPTDTSAPTRAWSLAARLTFWYASSVFLVTALVAAALYSVLVATLDRQDDQFLAQTVQLLRASLREGPDDLPMLLQRIERRNSTLAPRTQVFARVLDDRGNVIVETLGADAIFLQKTLDAEAADAEPGPGVDVAAHGTSFRALAAWAWGGSDGQRPRLIQIARDRMAVSQILRTYRLRLYLVLGFALFVAGATGYAIASRGMRPLRTLTDAARRIRSSTLDERMPTAHLPAELLSLANTFNETLQRLEDAFTRLSSLSANLAHELRTPINNVRGEVEVALGKSRTVGEYQESLESVLEECVHLSETIDALLFLGRADFAEAQMIRTDIDARRELEGVCELYQPTAAEAGVELRVTIDTDGTRTGVDRTLFLRAISNLIANAINHTPAGGSVEVTARTKDQNLEVSIVDTGTGMPAAHLSQITDRFYRVAPFRSFASGSLGLGLTIVHSIVKVHGGSMNIVSEPGVGTTVTLVFPTAPTHVGEPAAVSSLGT